MAMMPTAISGYVLAADCSLILSTMSTPRTFENCWKFSYVSTNHDNLVFEHKRQDGKWVTEKRDRYGNRLGVSIRSEIEMRPIFNHMQCVAQCEFYSMSQLSDFSVYSV